MHSNLKNQILCSVLPSIMSFSALASNEGRVVTVRGEVNINGNSSKIGDVVHAGAKIETGSGAFISILFGQESVMHITSDSQIKVESVSNNNVLVYLEKGAIDGVKKISAKNTETITVKTPAAKYELSGGRYAVQGSSKTGEGEKFLVLDGDGKVTHLTSSSDGKHKAGTTQTVKSQTLFSLAPAPASGDTGSAPVVQTKKITEEQVQNLRPSVSEVPGPNEKAQQLANAITNPQVPLVNGDRAPASVESQVPPRSPSSASLEGERNPVRNLQPINHGQLPRDPGQAIPGRSDAAVSVIFQP